MKTRIQPLINFFILRLSIAVLIFGVIPGLQIARAETGTILSLYPNWFFDGVESGENMGSAVSSAGDVNGDGLVDVLIGAQKHTLNEYREGAAFVFFNHNGSLSALPDWKIGSGQQGSLFGCSLSDLGDVNGDDLDDIIIGACDFNLVEGGVVAKSKVGAAFVYYGSPTFTSKSSADWSFMGEQVDGRLGSAVNAAGDLNQDGYADVIIGEPSFDGNDLLNNGKAYVFYGAEDGLATIPAWAASGNANAELFGSAVANAGDVNGDGWNDIIIGAPRPGNPASLQIGYAYVFYNSVDGLSATMSWSATNNQAGAWFGASVAGVGDVNQDGYDDVLIGAPYTKVLIEDKPESAGCTYLYLGSENGLATSPAWSYCADQAGGKFGASVSPAGDMNKDTYQDFLVGMPFYSVSNEHQGAVYLFFGNPNGVKSDYFEKTFGNKADTEFGTSVSGVGDINDDDRLDIIVGAPNYKSSNERVGRAMIYYAGLPGIPDEDLFSIFLPVIQK
ncbi:MAG: integrin alpha [Anaerolineaceae bacterium]|jgi:hypothetical protein|nr:integrin alpha [Anaerolineaceae bacterium]